MKYIGKKRLFISLIITFLIVGMFAPLYGASTMFDSIYRSQFSNKKSTVQLSNTTGGGNSNGYINVLLPQGSYDYCKDKENCIILTEKISSDWQNHKIQFQTFGSNQVTIRLSSPKKENSKRIKYPVVVDYQNLKVNNETIFSEPKALWDDEPFEYTLKVHNGETVELEIDIRRHHWTFDEIKDLQHFNPLMLLSVFILAFFFSYQVVQYIAQYKILQHYSRIDIFFLSVFIILLLIPASYMSKEEKSLRENRMLASSPSLFINNTFNTNYTKQFEDWFNDRFRGRKSFISFYKHFTYFLAKNLYSYKDLYFNKKTFWGFSKGEIISRQMTKKERLTFINNVKRLKSFADNYNINLYINVVPTAPCIYPESRFPFSIDCSNIDLIREDFKSNGLSNLLILPYEELKGHTDLVMHKLDPHWSEYGAFIGYQIVMRKIKERYPKLKILSENDFKITHSNLTRTDFDYKPSPGYIFNQLQLSEKVLTAQYKNYEPKNVSLKILKFEPATTITKSKNQNPLKVYMIGNSYMENLFYFMRYSFNDVIKKRMNPPEFSSWEFSRWEKDIIKNKPDILILTTTLSSGDPLKGIFKEDK